MAQLLVAGPGGTSTNSKPNYIMVSQLSPSPLYQCQPSSVVPADRQIEVMIDVPRLIKANRFL
jgi:hypothetical protein